jgi:hypothetical protein
MEYLKKQSSRYMGKLYFEVNDGGYYFTLEMNLETGEIYYFSPHDLA